MDEQATELMMHLSGKASEKPREHTPGNAGLRQPDIAPFQMERSQWVVDQDACPHLLQQAGDAIALVVAGGPQRNTTAELKTSRRDLSASVVWSCRHPCPLNKNPNISTPKPAGYKNSGSAQTEAVQQNIRSAHLPARSVVIRSTQIQSKLCFGLHDAPNSGIHCRKQAVRTNTEQIPGALSDLVSMGESSVCLPDA